jgi:hypothetical protein
MLNQQDLTIVANAIPIPKEAKARIATFRIHAVPGHRDVPLKNRIIKHGRLNGTPL